MAVCPPSWFWKWLTAPRQNLKSVLMRFCLWGLTPSLPYSLGLVYLHPSWGINLFQDSRRDNWFILFVCFCPAITKVVQDFGENGIVQIQVEMKGEEVTACHAGDTDPRGINSAHAENKGMVFHVLLACLMCCTHLLLLCSLWHNSEHRYICHSSQKAKTFLFSVSSRQVKK